MFAALRQRDFALLWVGQLVSLFGDWVLLIALPFSVFNLTGSALATGAMFGANTVPRVLLGSVAGVFVDRWDRKRTMIAADLSRALVLLPLLAVHSVRWLWVVYAVAFVQSAIGQCFLPAKNAIIPGLVPESDLVAANALSSVSENLTRLTGPALGGILFGLFGLTSVVLIDSASYLVSGLMIALIVTARMPATATKSAPARFSAVLGEWRDGVRLMRRDRLITAIFLTMGTAMIAEGIIQALLIPFVKELLHKDASGFGWLVSAQAVGGLIGSIFLARASRALRPALLIPLSGLLFGLCDLGLFNVTRYAPAHAFLAALAMIALAGVVIVGFFVGLTTLLQTSAADHYRGRVFGAFYTTIALMTLLGQGVGSLLGDPVGIVPMLTVAAGFDLLAALVALVTLRRATAEADGPGSDATPLPLSDEVAIER